MSSPEFDLIRRFFTEQAVRRDDVLLGIGDDAALLSAPPGMALAVSTDTLISGVHFPENTHPHAIGHKALAVNLSDLAAMGAEPAWVTLAISLPENNATWLSEFARGFFELAAEFDVQLVGGDTTRGPLSITVQITGFVPAAQALTRSSAQVGDAVFLTGTLGDAGLGLQFQPQAQLDDDTRKLIQRLEYPTPRIAAGLALRDLANSAIDISDGLAADLGHVLTASGVGADIDIECLPLSTAFCSVVTRGAWPMAVSAGDDYELCFTAPSSQQAEVLARLNDICPCVCIGTITTQSGLRWRDAQQNELAIGQAGFDHFQRAGQ